ncbi:Abi family protein [Fructilactobacillus hinvesii]|uniref:Abi family protein n=1 Tax=Fructilactobacillus hinvesii TaxID=2940300 RepID=A0ABY5BX02_9LACO|nr:Abi family protein [Fructilactobacillus hinvesii]
MIKDSTDKVRLNIAHDLKYFIKANNYATSANINPKIMDSFIKNIHETRNICAHNNRLIAFKCHSSSKYFSLIHDKYDLIDRDSRKSVYSTFASLECFLSETEFKMLNNTFRKRFRWLDRHLVMIDANQIGGLIGFPIDWFKKPKLVQG